MKRYIAISLMGMAVMVGSAHGMEATDAKNLHDNLDALINVGNNQITVHSLVGENPTQLGQELSRAYHTNLLATVRGVTINQDGSLDIADAFGASDVTQPTLPTSPKTTRTKKEQAWICTKPVLYFGAGALTAVLATKYLGSGGGE